jgi:hypothetical protein
VLEKAPPKKPLAVESAQLEVVGSLLSRPLQCFARRRARASESHGFNEAFFGKCVFFGSLMGRS